MSLDAQSTRLIEYAKRKNLEIIKSFQIVESSTQGDRKKFKEVIDFIKKQKEPIALLADAVDRVQRSFKESVMLDDLVRKEKLELHFYRENMVIGKTASAMNVMQWDFAVMGAKSYVLQLSENVKRSLEFKANNGELGGAAPVGYENYHDEFGKSKIRFHPVYAPLVKQMFEMYSLGRMSLKELAHFAELHHIVGRKGVVLTASTIHTMIKNPFYYGVMKWKGVLRPHVYPPLISQELWERCQDVRMGVKAADKPFKYGEKEFLYKGLIKCANTGKICPCELKRERLSYVVCFDKQGKRKYIPEQDITDQIAYILHTIKIPDEIIASLHEYLKASKESEIRFREAELQKLQADLTRTLNRIDRLCNLYLDGEITKEDYLIKNNSLINDREKLKAQIDGHSSADDGFNRIVCELVDIARNAWDIFIKSPNTAAKRSLIKFIIRTMELDEGNLGFELNFPFNKLSNFGKCDNSKNAKIRTAKNNEKTKGCDTKSQPYQIWLPLLDSLRTCHEEMKVIESQLHYLKEAIPFLFAYH